MSGFCLLLPGYLTVHGSAHPDPSSSSFSMPSFVLFTGCSLARKLLPHQPFLGWHLSGPPTSIAILSSQKALSSSLGLFLSSRTDLVCFNPVSLFVGVPLLVYILLKHFLLPTGHKLPETWSLPVFIYVCSQHLLWRLLCGRNSSYIC